MIQLKCFKSTKTQTQIYLVNSSKDLQKKYFNADEIAYIDYQLKLDKKYISLSSYNVLKEVIILQNDYKNINNNTSNDYYAHYEIMKNAAKIFALANKVEIANLTVENLTGIPEVSQFFAKGFLLKAYQFDKYFTDKTTKTVFVKKLSVVDSNLKPTDLTKTVNECEAVYLTRDLVNEPVSYLTAEMLANKIKKMGDKAGFHVEIFKKKKIEAMKMGGLLAVNKGSFDDPTFTISEYKPKNAINKQPYVLVGKGVVFDTGGLSLKPTAGSMDEMKCDMAGAATVAGTMYVIAKNKLPVWVVGLTPATDNRPGNKAYAPQDIITMHNGKTVEVLNTDAEGRMILADALSYAQKYKPMLVIDMATLTGSAQAAIGNFATVGMQAKADIEFNNLQNAGNYACERVVEFPFWDEYADMLKSEVADMKNIGGKVAGAITAGKFLEKFTDYPYIHLDIAGPAYITEPKDYLSVGGTAVGVSLLYQFFYQKSNQK